MKKLSLLIFSIFFIIFISMFNIPNSYPQTYYNHINNPSFSQYNNYIEDGSLESGDFEQGIIFGNFTDNGGLINTDSAHTGSYSLRVLSGYTSVFYNLSSSYYVLGADITTFDFYTRSLTGSGNLYIEFTYEDTSTNYVIKTATNSSWIYYDLTSNINTAKTLTAIEFRYGGSGNHCVDDINLYVDDGYGQDDITSSSYPWFLSSPNEEYAGLNTVLGRIDNTSAYFGYASSNVKLFQSLDGIDTDNIGYIEVYAHSTATFYIGLRCRVIYSDRTYDYKDVQFNSSSTWVNINFGVSWIDSNKYIISIDFTLDDEYSAYVNLDDVGLWVDYPNGYKKFVYVISPTAITQNSFSFEAYSNINYAMSCYFYNLTDNSLSINGTYIFNDVYGIQEGNMENGFFTISLSKRTYSSSPYTEEVISIVINTNEEVFNIDITVYWYPNNSGETPTNIDSNLITNFMIIGLLLFAPSVTIGYLGMKINPTMGIITFIGGLTLMGSICLQINVINIWFMFAILIIDTIIVLGLLKTGRIG